MKKLVFCAVVAVLVMGCDIEIPNTTVVNNSSFTVLFNYSSNDNNVITLSPNASTSTSDIYYPIIHIQQPEKRVKESRDQPNHVITISDLPSWEVYVNNKSLNPVTLTAGGWMDNMLNIPVGDFVDDSVHKGRVYTKNPVFTIKSTTFPLDIQWQLVDDIFYVVIRD
jgi:hypothetical protein